MRTSILIVTAVLTCNCGLAQTSRSTEVGRKEMETARNRVYPALVNITAVTRYFRNGKAMRSPSGGSGVIVTAQGHVITNFHVAGHSTRLSCTTTTGETIDADVVTHDPLTDLSVLKLRMDKRPAGSIPLTVAPIGDSDLVQVGDGVMAMGNPLLLSSSMTLGIVSNTKRVFTDPVGSHMEEQDLDTGEFTGMFTRWIQHDALILPGNSGGPLVNMRGEVIGINELGGGGVGFAIPSNIASEVLKQTLATGKVIRGWMGLTMLPVDKLGLKSGALVASVEPDSPADKSGIKPGDIVNQIAGVPVNVRFFEEVPLFYQRVAGLAVGKPVEIALTRGRGPLSLKVDVVAMEDVRLLEEEARNLGITFSPITKTLMIQERYPNRDGVQVTGVRQGYPFDTATPKLEAGDVVIAVDGKSVKGAKEFVQSVTPVPKKPFTVAVRRNREYIVSVVKPLEEDAVDDNVELPKAWVGVKTQVLLADLATALGMPGVKGYRVTQVYPETEAAKAGLQPGDVITTLNGKKLDAYRQQDEGDFKRTVEEISIGEKVKLGVLRSGKSSVVTILLQDQPSGADRAKKAHQRELEFQGRDITPMDRVENRWRADQKGLMVTETTPGGWGQMSGLRVEDVILSVNDRSVDGALTFEAIMKEILKGRPRIVKVFLMREAQTHFVFIEPDWDKLLSSSKTIKDE